MVVKGGQEQIGTGLCRIEVGTGIEGKKGMGVQGGEKRVGGAYPHEPGSRGARVDARASEYKSRRETDGRENFFLLIGRSSYSGASKGKKKKKINEG